MEPTNNNKIQPGTSKHLLGVKPTSSSSKQEELKIKNAKYVEVINFKSFIINPYFNLFKCRNCLIVLLIILIKVLTDLKQT